MLRAITAAEPQLYAEMDAESAGKRSGTSGTQIGHAYLKGAFSEAAVLVLRHHPAGQTYLVRVENNHGKGKALTVLAHQLARAV